MLQGVHIQFDDAPLLPTCAHHVCMIGLNFATSVKSETFLLYLLEIACLAATFHLQSI